MYGFIEVQVLYSCICLVWINRIPYHGNGDGELKECCSLTIHLNISALRSFTPAQRKYGAFFPLSFPPFSKNALRRSFIFCPYEADYKQDCVTLSVIHKEMIPLRFRNHPGKKQATNQEQAFCFIHVIASSVL